MAIFTYKQKEAIYKRIASGIAKREKTKYQTGLVKKINRDKNGEIK